jgi:hypothetical protein
MTPPAHTITDEQFQGVILLGLSDHDQVRSKIDDLAQLDTGFTPPIYLVETDVRVAREAVIDLGIGVDERFKGFFGPNAGRELIGSLASRQDEISIPRRVIPGGAHDPSMRTWIENELEKIRDEQRGRLRHWNEVIAERASLRDDAYWADRFRSIQGGDPAKVLIITTRFSTYMQHSNRDLARSLEQMGNRVAVLTEPDPYTMLTPQLSVKAHLDFDPDIVITTNYPRASLAETFPAGAVSICWVQDAMSHLFYPLPDEITPLDFLVGYVYPGASATRLYPADQQLALPLSVSESKFCSEPVSQDLEDEYTCDIAYISHQSGTVDELQAELLKLSDPSLHPLLHRVSAWAHSKAARYHDSILNLHEGSIAEAFGEEIEKLGSPEIGRSLWHQYAYPLLERILRHEMLEWAGEIAQRHKLDFRIYGRGWDRHPSLARYAYGELSHGEDLRASYQCARVQLHASTQGVSHQRQYECAFSGGFMLSRRVWHDFVRLNWEDALEYTRSASAPDACLVEERHPCYSLRNHPRLQRLADDRKRIPPHPVLWDAERFSEVFLFHPDYLRVEEWENTSTPLAKRQLRLLSDPYEMTFSTRQELERQILRSCSDKHWRRSHAERTRDTMLEHVSMGCFANQLMTFLCDRVSKLHHTRRTEVFA